MWLTFFQTKTSAVERKLLVVTMVAHMVAIVTNQGFGGFSHLQCRAIFDDSVYRRACSFSKSRTFPSHRHHHHHLTINHRPIINQSVICSFRLCCLSVSLGFQFHCFLWFFPLYFSMFRLVLKQARWCCLRFSKECGSAARSLNTKVKTFLLPKF